MTTGHDPRITTGYDPKITRNKTIEAGASVGGAGILLAFILSLVRQNNPDLPWSPEQDIYLIGALTGVIGGIARGVQNWWKNRGIFK